MQVLRDTQDPLLTVSRFLKLLLLQGFSEGGVLHAYNKREARQVKALLRKTPAVVHYLPTPFSLFFPQLVYDFLLSQQNTRSFPFLSELVDSFVTGRSYAFICDWPRPVSSRSAKQPGCRSPPIVPIILERYSVPKWLRFLN